MEADKQEKTENELIAEFMGYEFGVVNYYGQKDETEFQRKYEKVFDEIVLDSIGNYFFNPTTKDFFLKVEANNYRIKWDWLMPVVEKINETIHPTLGERVDVIIYRRTCHINDQEQIIIETTGKNMLDCTYKAVVEFIKFYNSQKPLPL